MNFKEIDTKKLLESHGFKQEKAQPRFLDTPNSDFPEPIKRYKLVLESFGMSVEEPYFWILNMLKESFQFTDLKKVKDVYTATETSSFFGLTSDRLQRQQGMGMQYIAQIGKLVKELFGMVNDIKKIDVRLEMYSESNKSYRDKETDEDYNRPESQSAEIALKNLWIELIEGGGRNPSSVFGLAQNLGFATLPDLFFSSSVKNSKEVDGIVEKLAFNEKVKTVLKSKLFAYFSWKEKTFYEYTNRRKFLIKYLRQHYEIIKTYMQWARPYLLHAKRLAIDEKRLSSAEMVGAFEQSMIEIEFLAKKKGKKYNQCLLSHFLYTTKPALEFHKEGPQNRGAIHVGRVEITLRGYAWTDEEVQKYLDMRQIEDFELLGAVDSSIDASLGLYLDDLKQYLKEAGAEIFKEDEKPKEIKKEERPKQDLLEPFKELAKIAYEPARLMGRGIAEIAGIKLPELGGKKIDKKSKKESKDELSQTKKGIEKTLFLTYNIFKKAHLMPGF